MRRRPNYRRIVALERELGFGPQRDDWVDAEVPAHEIDGHLLPRQGVRRITLPWSEPWPRVIDRFAGTLIGASISSALTFAMAPGARWEINEGASAHLLRDHCLPPIIEALEQREEVAA